MFFSHGYRPTPRSWAMIRLVMVSLVLAGSLLSVQSNAQDQTPSLSHPPLKTKLIIPNISLRQAQDLPPRTHLHLETELIVPDIHLRRANSSSAGSPILVRYPHSPLPTNRPAWDLYVDDRWAIPGGDVAQNLAELVPLTRRQHRAEIVLEAYCDDRDTSAYSLVTGAYWLKEIERYLVSLGVSPSAISTVSYGKDSIRCANSSVECWEANLRLHETFRLMSLDDSNHGCLVRVIVDRSHMDTHHTVEVMGVSTFQRLHVSLSSK